MNINKKVGRHGDSATSNANYYTKIEKRGQIVYTVAMEKLELPQVYDPQSVEEKWYEFWQKHVLFSPENVLKAHAKPISKAFTIVIPPPNVTGALHMGHALNNTLQDILIRWRRMQGYASLWVPGTDHGGIATQHVVEKLLLSQNKNQTRQNLGREKFLEHMWQWRNQSGDTILMQLKRLACSCDWSRTMFTMDETCSKAVMEAFVRLYNRGLIYRGKRLVNWCVRCGTALADIEVEYEQKQGKLWHIRYPVINSNGKYLVVATTRPETMLGDSAVAVHPEDSRHNHLIGKTIRLPLVEPDRAIPIIADNAVDPQFGTGAVKVTPSHDPADFEIASRHNLPHYNVIDFSGKMTLDAGQTFIGLDRTEARAKVIQMLEEQGLLEKTEDYVHSVGVCYRCGTIIEPLESEQWFLKTTDMAQKAYKATADGRLKIIPESWVKPYLNWLDNIKDWCLSRQIWWGHRIPVWYCKRQGLEARDLGLAKKSCQSIVSATQPLNCPTCGDTNLVQDPDVLDTWFSSALWPFSVFGWPDINEDLKKYFPTAVLVTGHEILYLWVARMAMMSLELLNEIPFKDVFIHGIVRDSRGKKMSKSLGNVIDPLDIVKKFGADALRFSLISSTAPGRDMQISEENFVSSRNFANKIWNASRFVIMNLNPTDVPSPPGGEGGVRGYLFVNSSLSLWERVGVRGIKIAPNEVSSLADRWILSRYHKTIEATTQALDVYDLGRAARTLYEFFWSEFCDWYVELSKIELYGNAPERKTTTQIVLFEVLAGTLKLLHPFLPFLTEEIWQHLKTNPDSSIMTEPWPEPDNRLFDEKSEQQMSLLISIINELRTLRSDMEIPPKITIKAIAQAWSDETKNLIESNIPFFRQLAKVENIDFNWKTKIPAHSATVVAKGVELFVPLEGLIVIDRERERLQKAAAKAKTDLEHQASKLSNANFVNRAPQSEVEKIRLKANEAKKRHEQLTRYLSALKDH